VVWFDMVGTEQQQILGMVEMYEEAISQELCVSF
jgi:hypothetical protein